MPAAITTVIEPRPRDLGGFEVRRVLPSVGHRMVGPFIFFDHLGPATFPPGKGIDVRPHPHIGLATVTYLFEGGLRHRDSLGFVQDIKPGAVNWMTAGHGIVHSERTNDEDRAAVLKVHGIQSWVALPKAQEETDPSFHHHPADTLPEIGSGEAVLRLIAGSAFGETSPVKTFSAMFYLDGRMPEGSSVGLPDEYEERALYVADGAVEIAGDVFDTGKMVVFEAGASISARALEDSRVMLLGGEAMDGPRHVWWNLVSSREERIEQAKRDWKEGRFPQVPGETEFIPLPE